MECFETTLEPYSRIQDLYQSYYRKSISAYCEQENILYRESGPSFAGVLRFLGRVRQSERFNSVVPARIRTAVLDGVAGLLGAGTTVEHAVGKYVHHGSGAEIKICIDAEDSGAIRLPDLLEWSDLYFKTNYWPDREYHPKVLPLANVNPLVFTRQEELRGYRNCRTEWDLFGFFRVWGRIDHNLALFEALAQLRCRKKLIAYLISADFVTEAARLEKAGIAWTTRPMPLKKLWSLSARSKLNIVRHGVEDCIPWRMTDTMAMGHCPVLDYRAKTRWHIPLLENVHYLSLDVPPEHDIAPKEFTSRVVERIEGWLSKKGLIATVAENSAAYFDENLAPAPLGRHLVEQSRNRCAQGALANTAG
jgi:hypothetical protein